MNVPVLASGGRVAAIVPQTMAECFKLAEVVFRSGMAPSGFKNPEACMVAIMHGLEIGLTPMAALQRIAVVNGRPTVWGDGAIGLVRASGVCEFIRERIDGTGDQRVAVCETKRRDDPEIIVRTFSVDDAKRADLWDTREKVTRRSRDGGTYDARNDSPWHRYPERMLQMRARAFALRDGFADVLGGLYLREEIDDTPPAPMKDVTPQPAAIEGPAEIVTSDDAPLSAHDPAEAAEYVTVALNTIANLESIEDCRTYWQEHASIRRRLALSQEQVDTLRQALVSRHAALLKQHDEAVGASKEEAPEAETAAPAESEMSA